MMKKLVIFSLIGIFLLSGCEQLKELYGIQTLEEEEYIPIEEIKIEGEELSELPEIPSEEEVEEGEVIEEVPGEEIIIEEIPEEEIVEEVPGEEIIIEEIPEEGVEEIPMEEIVIEEEPEEITEEAKVIIAEETELVSLKPKASDPDDDALSFTYTTPLDEEGKWQTTYGDEGEYTITITASDGELSATKDVLIIINKKEEAPVIDDAVPGDGILEAKEDSTLEFSVKASDLNKDVLSYSWKLDGEEVSTEDSYIYELGYAAAGQHSVEIVVSDGVEEASKTWTVDVENVNREPVLEEIADIAVDETDTVVLAPSASDPDDEELTFSVDSDKFSEVDGVFEWETTYDDAGAYSVTVTASDGEDEVSQEVKITVENVNRAPVIEDIILE